MTEQKKEMKTAIILGRQGSGKTTLGKDIVKTFLRNSKGKKPRVLAYSPTGDIPDACPIEDIYEFMREKSADPSEDAYEPHILHIDETMLVFSLASAEERAVWRRYWTIARHAGLKLAVFISPRYVDLEPFIRAAKTQLFVSCSMREGVDLKRIDDEGGVFYRLPKDQIRIGEFQDVLLHDQDTGLQIFSGKPD